MVRNDCHPRLRKLRQEEDYKQTERNEKEIKANAAWAHNEEIILDLSVGYRLLSLSLNDLENSVNTFLTL